MMLEHPLALPKCPTHHPSGWEGMPSLRVRIPADPPGSSASQLHRTAALTGMKLEEGEAGGKLEERTLRSSPSCPHFPLGF